MDFTPDTIKQTLLTHVSNQTAFLQKYVKNENDFTRTRKISYTDAILATLSMQKDRSKVELLKYFDFSPTAPTPSALIQQRSKISVRAFEDLFYSFSNAFDFQKKFKGFELIAIDGSDIYLPRNPKDSETYHISDKYNKGFNMLHLNAAYNLCTERYTDIHIQPFNQINEYKAM